MTLLCQDGEKGKKNYWGRGKVHIGEKGGFPMEMNDRASSYMISKC